MSVAVGIAQPAQRVALAAGQRDGARRRAARARRRRTPRRRPAAPPWPGRRRSPTTNSRLSSSPATKKKMASRPSAAHVPEGEVEVQRGRADDGVAQARCRRRTRACSPRRARPRRRPAAARRRRSRCAARRRRRCASGQLAGGGCAGEGGWRVLYGTSRSGVRKARVETSLADQFLAHLWPGYRTARPGRPSAGLVRASCADASAFPALASGPSVDCGGPKSGESRLSRR